MTKQGFYIKLCLEVKGVILSEKFDVNAWKNSTMQRIDESINAQKIIEEKQNKLDNDLINLNQEQRTDYLWNEHKEVNKFVEENNLNSKVLKRKKV